MSNVGIFLNFVEYTCSQPIWCKQFKLFCARCKNVIIFDKKCIIYVRNKNLNVYFLKLIRIQLNIVNIFANRYIQKYTYIYLAIAYTKFCKLDFEINPLILQVVFKVQNIHYIFMNTQTQEQVVS